jgi:hypothetical protein
MIFGGLAGETGMPGDAGVYFGFRCARDVGLTAGQAGAKR